MTRMADIVFRKLTMADLAAQVAFENNCRAALAGTPAEAHVDYLTTAQKVAILQSEHDAIYGLWQDGELVAQTVAQRGRIADKFAGRLALLDNVPEIDGYYYRNGLVAPNRKGAQYLTLLFHHLLAETADHDGLPAAFATLTTNGPVYRMAAETGFVETAPMRRHKDGADMCLFVRQPGAVAKAAVA